MELSNVIENLRQEEASVRRLFEGDAQVRAKQNNAAKLVEAARFIERVQKGQLPMHYMKEAMTTSDFPLLFADVLDRQLLGYYQETPSTWQSYARRSLVPDFRSVKRYAVDGAEGVLEPVPERGEYPEGALVESADEYAVQKHGRRIDLSWEAIINDDLDAFMTLPERLARAARRSENKFATQLFVDANGPHASLYSAPLGNIVPGNPALSIEGLQTAMQHLAEAVDEDGEPILIDMVTLVVPPALEITARNILNAIQLEITGGTGGGSSDTKLIAQNWMSNRVKLEVEHYIPHVAINANGNTSWFLFATPSTGRPALEMGFLRGHEQPALYERVSNARRVGGGEVSESFDDDSRAWRVRHVFGGARLLSTGGAKATVASNGTGSGS